MPRIRASILLGIDFWKAFQLATDVFKVNEIDIWFDWDMHTLTPDQKESHSSDWCIPIIWKIRTWSHYPRKHSIKLVEGTNPIKDKHYPTSPAMQHIMYEEIKKILELAL